MENEFERQVENLLEKEYPKLAAISKDEFNKIVEPLRKSVAQIPNCDLEKVTLYDVYEAIGSPTMLAIGNRTESSKCLVEKAVNTATDHVFREAESVLTEKFQNTTLADIHKVIKKHSTHTDS